MSTEPNPVRDVDPDEARSLLAAGAFLLDVREDDEWHAGHAPEAVHVPMGLVGDRIAELPADRMVLCICRVGGRSGAVAGALTGLGLDVLNVRGGMMAWAESGFPVVIAEGDIGRVI